MQTTWQALLAVSGRSERPVCKGRTCHHYEVGTEVRGSAGLGDVLQQVQVQPWHWPWLWSLAKVRQQDAGQGFNSAFSLYFCDSDSYIA